MLELYEPDADIIGDVATFERLQAAEKACREATALVNTLQRKLDEERDAEVTERPTPRRLSYLSLHAFTQKTREALNEWRALLGQKPLGR